MRLKTLCAGFLQKRLLLYYPCGAIVTRSRPFSADIGESSKPQTRDGGTNGFSPIVLAKLANMSEKYNELERSMNSEQLGHDQRREVAKEISQLYRVVNPYQKLNMISKKKSELLKFISDSQNIMKSDPTLRGEWETLVAEAQSELMDCEQEKKETEKSLLQGLVPCPESYHRPAIMEIRPGTGGDEAGLFADDLFNMYLMYAEHKGWQAEILQRTTSEVGGLREGSLLMKWAGDENSSDAESLGAYGILRHESGVHRVQRVPETEAGGRVHTSTATVVVMMEARDVDMSGLMNESDIRMDVYRSSGAGGQHVNTTESAVRLTHIPTGVVVCVQDERSQHKNRAKAMKILQSRIYEAEQRRVSQERQELRSSLMGSGERNERIRTYNYQQERITDHRIGLTVFGIEEMMEGKLLDQFLFALHEDESKRLIERAIKEMELT